MAVHGLRKWFVTELTEAIKNPVVVGPLVGHDVGLQGHYYKPSLEDLLAEHRGGTNALTISDEMALKEENTKLGREYNQLREETAEMLKWYAENVKGKQGYSSIINFFKFPSLL